VREIRLQCCDSDLPNLLVAVDFLLRQEPDQDEDENDEDKDEGGRKEDEDEDEDERDDGYSE
jgi:hypothetical protein